MAIDDATFAQYPAEFQARRSPGRLALLLGAGILLLVGAVLAIVFADAVRAGAEAWQGRRSGLAPVVLPVAIVFPAFLALICFLLAWSETTVWRRVETGTTMSRTAMHLADDAAADAVHERLRSGDPDVYRPLPAVRKGAVLLRIYRADADRTAYLTLQRGKGAGARTWPLITFTGPAYASLAPLKADTLTRAPGSGFDAVEQTLRDLP